MTPSMPIARARLTAPAWSVGVRAAACGRGSGGRCARSVSSRRRAKLPIVRPMSSTRPTPWALIAARTSGASAIRSTSCWASSLASSRRQTSSTSSLSIASSSACLTASLSSAPCDRLLDRPGPGGPGPSPARPPRSRPRRRSPPRRRPRRRGRRRSRRRPSEPRGRRRRAGGRGGGAGCSRAATARWGRRRIGAVSHRAASLNARRANCTLGPHIGQRLRSAGVAGLCGWLRVTSVTQPQHRLPARVPSLTRNRPRQAPAADGGRALQTMPPGPWSPESRFLPRSSRSRGRHAAAARAGCARTTGHRPTNGGCSPC